MKIVIFNRGDDLEYIGKFTNGDFAPRLVCSVGFLRHIISENPNEDIEGIILPTAKNNSDLADILQEIYRHKQDLYLNSQAPFPNKSPANVFMEAMKQKFPGILP